LGARLQGEQRMQELAPAIVEYLAHWLEARVGTMYVTQGHGAYERQGSYALLPGGAADVVHPGEGLVGQALQSRTLMHVKDVPEGYLPVSSSTGRAKPAELVILPIRLSG